MIWLLRDIDLLGTLLRAANLSFEALLLGGIAFLLVVARPAKASSIVESICLRGIGWAALALAAWVVTRLLAVRKYRFTKVAVLLSALPFGFFGVLFGVSYRTRSQEAGSMVIASTIFSVVTLGGVIALFYSG